MALTEDIVLTHSEGWRAIVPTGTYMIVEVVEGNTITCRLGISSISDGFPLDKGDSVRVAETLYIQSTRSVKNRTVISVTNI